MTKVTSCNVKFVRLTKKMTTATRDSFREQKQKKVLNLDFVHVT